VREIEGRPLRAGATGVDGRTQVEAM